MISRCVFDQRAKGYSKQAVQEDADLLNGSECTVNRPES